VSYIIFFSLGAPAMPQLYASARESINQYRSSIAVMANTILRSMFSFGFLFGSLVGSLLLARFDFVSFFCGTVIIFIVVFISPMFCFVMLFILIYFYFSYFHDNIIFNK